MVSVKRCVISIDMGQGRVQLGKCAILLHLQMLGICVASKKEQCNVKHNQLLLKLSVYAGINFKFE